MRMPNKQIERTAGPVTALAIRRQAAPTRLCRARAAPGPPVRSFAALGRWQLSLGSLATGKEEENLAQCIIRPVEGSVRNS